MNNQQASTAGNDADELINQLANPGQVIETKDGEVKVLDQAQPVGTQPPPTQPQASTEDWERRFKGSKASSDRTIHALRQQAKHFDGMEGRLSALEEENKALKANQPAAPNGMNEFFSEEESSAVGKYVESKVSAMDKKVSDISGELDRRIAEEAKRKVEEELALIVDAVARSVSNYSDIDSDPAFRVYMNDTDSFGNVRMTLLDYAKATIPPDIERIVQFYKDYSAIKEAQVKEETNTGGLFTQQELMQDPSSSASSSPAAPQRGKRIWTTALMSQFYKDRTAGKIPPEEAVALEKELFASLGRKAA